MSCPCPWMVEMQTTVQMQTGVNNKHCNGLQKEKRTTRPLLVFKPSNLL